MVLWQALKHAGSQFVGLFVLRRDERSPAPLRPPAVNTSSASIPGSTVDDYRHLWDDQSSRYALLRCGKENQEVETYVYDREQGMVLLIEGESLAQEVIARMVAAGAEELRTPDGQ